LLRGLQLRKGRCVFSFCRWFRTFPWATREGPLGPHRFVLGPGSPFFPPVSWPNQCGARALGPRPGAGGFVADSLVHLFRLCRRVREESFFFSSPSFPLPPGFLNKAAASIWISVPGFLPLRWTGAFPAGISPREVFIGSAAWPERSLESFVTFFFFADPPPLRFHFLAAAF